MVMDYVVTGLIFYSPAAILGTIFMLAIRCRPFALALSIAIVLACSWLLFSMIVGFATTYGCAPGSSELWCGWPAPIILICLPLLKARAQSAPHYLRIPWTSCPECDYPIGTSPVCTECGEPVKGRYVEVKA
jgi:hypothetical protein